MADPGPRLVLALQISRRAGCIADRVTLRPRLRAAPTTLLPPLRGQRVTRRDVVRTMVGAGGRRDQTATTGAPSRRPGHGPLDRPSRRGDGGAGDRVALARRRLMLSPLGAPVAATARPLGVDSIEA